MNTVAKFGFAVLVAVVLLLTPVGACMAPGGAATSEASHPCCPPKPAPLPDDCARPGCIYMDTKVVPAAASATDAGPLSASPAPLTRVEPVPVSPLARAAEQAPPARSQRYVVFHQLLI